MTVRLFFVDETKNINKSKLIGYVSIDKAIDMALLEQGDHEAIEIWEGADLILSVANPRTIANDSTCFLKGEIPSTFLTTDLYGCAPNDWRLAMLWKRAMCVEPIDTFESQGSWIRSGHYVIDYCGDAIVVHCANTKDRRISVQFMFGDQPPCSYARCTIEPQLLGRVMVSNELQASVVEQKHLSELFKDGICCEQPVRKSNARLNHERSL